MYDSIYDEVKVVRILSLSPFLGLSKAAAVGYKRNRVMIVVVRLFGSCLVVAALGACTDASDNTVKAGLLMLVGGTACISVRGGLPGLRLAVAVVLIALSLAVVGDELGDRAAVALLTVGVMALRAEPQPFRCRACGTRESREGEYCVRCGAARGKQAAR